MSQRLVSRLEKSANLVLMIFILLICILSKLFHGTHGIY